MKYDDLKYPKQAQELVNLLEEDQLEWRDYARKEFATKDKSNLKDTKRLLRQKVKRRTSRMLEILEQIGEPSISNIGDESSLAVSVLATHASLETTRQVLKAFNILYAHDKKDVRYQSIPAMTDWVAILEHKPQTFGTIWLMDDQGNPFLPTVKDFEHINKRRNEYDIEPLRWPKSLAIPEDQQPWLLKPIADLTIRKPTKNEYSAFEQDFIS